MDRKISVKSIGLFFYVLYMIWVVIVEWINFFAKMFGRHNLKFGIAEIIASLLILAIIFFTRKNVKFEKIKPNLELVIGFILIVAVGFFFSVFPDGGFDTFNYHLIAQNPQFENYFIEDYGYGNFQVWGFRLCDRMFYYFRLVLGYRLGTMLNTIALCLSFSQIYVITGYIIGEEKEHSIVQRSVCNRLLWSLAIVFSLDSIMMFGSYYVDAIVMPIGIRVIREIIESAEDEVDSKNIYLFALLSGLWIGGKLTNIVYVIPCVIAYIIFHIKNFRIKDWIFSILLGLCSYAEYMIFNFVCTGNPFFPYYNTIFKSKYFPIVNFKDSRWGGKNIFEKIFWVVYAAIRPEYRQSEIWDKRNSLLIIGLLSAVALIIWVVAKFIKDKKIDKKIICLLVLAFSSALLWGVTTGISRYYIVGRVIWGIIAYIAIVYVANYKIKLVPQVVCGGLSILVIVSMLLNTASVALNGGWTTNQRTFEKLKGQVAKIFFDKGTEFSGEKLNMFILTDYMSMGAAELINSDAYSFNVNYIGNTVDDGNEVLQGKLEKYTYGYDLHKRAFGDIETYVETLNTYGLYITSITSCKTEIGEYEVIQLEKKDDETNIVWTSKDDSIRLDVSQINGKCKLEFISGMTYDWPVRDIELVVKDENDVLGSIRIDVNEIRHYELDLNINEDIDYILIDAYYCESGEMLAKEEIDNVFCLNFRLNNK